MQRQGCVEPSGQSTHRDLAILGAGGVVDDDGADAGGDAQLVVARPRHAQLQHAVQQPDPAPVPPAGTCRLGAVPGAMLALHS